MIKLKTEINYPDVAHAVEQANEQRLSAMRRGDVAALKELLADNSIYVFSTGMVETKAGQLKAIEQGTVKYEDDLHIRDVEIRAFSDNAVVIGVLESHLVLNGERQHLVNRFTMLWVKNANKWQMSSWQSTAIPQQT
jgi:ketosteroid isomerase-like protein